MQRKTLKLSNGFINTLVNLSESGMGYQIVKMVL